MYIYVHIYTHVKRGVECCCDGAVTLCCVAAISVRARPSVLAQHHANCTSKASEEEEEEAESWGRVVGGEVTVVLVMVRGEDLVGVAARVTAVEGWRGGGGRKGEIGGKGRVLEIMAHYVACGKCYNFKRRWRGVEALWHVSIRVYIYIHIHV